jgi:hypothetical protein
MSNTFFATGPSVLSSTLLSKVVSISSCMVFPEKYERRWMSMTDTNIQNPSSSGANKSMWPAIQVKPLLEGSKLAYRETRNNSRAYPCGIGHREPWRGTLEGVRRQVQSAHVVGCVPEIT